jgi:hypothetical protein
MLTSLSERVSVRNTPYQLDPLGHLADQTPADFEKMELGMRKVDPDVKVTIDVHDIKVRISGDTAIVTYSGTYTLPATKLLATTFPAPSSWLLTLGKSNLGSESNFWGRSFHGTNS